MLRSGETNVAKENFYGTKWVFKIISRLVETKINSEYLIGYLDKVFGYLVLVLSKMSGYVKTFKVKNGDKDKINKLMSFRVVNERY